MQDSKIDLEIPVDEVKIQDNIKVSFFEALIPIIVLVVLLAYNVFIYGDSATGGPNQFALIFAGVVAAIIGFKKTYHIMTCSKPL